MLFALPHLRLLHLNRLLQPTNPAEHYCIVQGTGPLKNVACSTESGRKRNLQVGGTKWLREDIAVKIRGTNYSTIPTIHGTNYATKGHTKIFQA